MSFKDDNDNSAAGAFVSWEEARGISERLKAFLPLCSAILFRSVLFFQAISSSQGKGRKNRLIQAAIFAVILGYIKFFLDVVNIHFFKYLAKIFLNGSEQLQINALSASVLHSPFFPLRPLINFILIFVILAISVKLILGFDKKLSPLFLVMCYKSAAEILYFVPLIGGFIALIWSLFLLLTGLREFYRVGTFRLVLAVIVMPFLISLFIITTVGSSFNKVVLSVYPEMKTQLVKINDTNAFVSMQDVIAAITRYKQELGFYPAHSGVLDKYLDRGIAQEINDPKGAGGYLYQYDKIDDNHFTIVARPAEINLTGRFIFYADEDGKVRLDNKQGREIQSAKEIQDLVFNSKG